MNRDFSRIKNLKPDYFIKTSDGFTIQTHKAILVSSSEFFNDLISLNGDDHVTFDNIDYITMNYIINLFYCGDPSPIDTAEEYLNILRWLDFFLVSLWDYLDVLVNLPYSEFLKLKPEDIRVEGNVTTEHYQDIIEHYQIKHSKNPNIPPNIGISDLSYIR